MSDLENMAMKIFNAYEDFYLDREKSKIFEELFDRYLTAVDEDGKTEPYEALVSLGHKHPEDFEKMVITLKNQSLLPD
jgi:hypothetical protein